MALAPYSEQDENKAIMAAIIDYWDREATAFGEFTRKIIPDGWWIEKKITTLFSGRKKLRIADIGTGAGFLAIKCAQLGHDVVATDVSSNMLDEAKRNASEFGVEIEFVKDDILDTKLEKQSFDLVMMRDVIFNVTNVEKTILNAIELIRPGGFIDIVDGNYFLYLNDEDYRKREDYFRLKNKTEEYRIMCDISLERFRELEALMKDLEPNKYCRPYKEMEILARHGMNNQSVFYSDNDDFSILTENGWAKLPFRYTLTAHKPLSDSEVLDWGSICQNDVLTTIEDTDISVSRVFDMLSNPDRVSILKHLDKEPCCVRELAEKIGLSEKMTSYHMVQLRDAGLVAYERVGREVVYHNTDSAALTRLILAASGFGGKDTSQS